MDPRALAGRGARASLLVATLLVALELALLQPGGASGWRLWCAIAGQLLAWSVAATLLGTVAATGLAAGVRWLARRAHTPERWAAALIVAALSAPGLLLLAGALASGQSAARWLGTPLRQTALLAVLVILAALAGAALWTLWQRARASGRGALDLAGAALLASALLLLADARLYRGLYGYLHWLLAGAALACAVLGASALDLWRTSRAADVGRPRWLAALLVALSLGAAGLVASRQLISVDGAVRHATASLTTLTAKLLLLEPKVARAVPRVIAPVRAPVAKTDEPPTSAAATLRSAHVLLVTVDALRADHVGLRRRARGAEQARSLTPNLDALARRGVRFTRAYCQAPLTCYSLPSLHSGDYLRSSLALRRRAPPTLAQLLRRHGWATWAFYNESVFFCDDARARRYGSARFGFARAATALRHADELASRAVALIARHARRRRRRPLFLWVHFFDTHEPYRRRAAHDFGRSAKARYEGEVAFVDAAIGRLLRAARALRGPRLTIISSDHGEAFGEHGNRYHGSSLYEEQVRVPLIIAGTGIASGAVASPAQLVDLAPTVADLVGVPRLPSFRGRSLAPTLLRPAAARAPASARVPGRVAISELAHRRMVTDGRFKLIVDRVRDVEALYDLRDDPAERRNLISRRPRVAARLRGELSRWLDQLRRPAPNAVAGAAEAPGASATSRSRRPRHRPALPGPLEAARLGDRRAVSGLIEMLSARRVLPRHRLAAARALGAMRAASAVAPLRRVLQSTLSKGLAREAAIALGELEYAPVWPLLRLALTDAADDVRVRAAIALARLRSAPQVRDVGAATPALVEGLVQADWQLARRAVHYLGQVGDQRAIAPAIAALRMEHLRRDLALALGALRRRFPDDKRVEAALRRLLRDAKSDVRAAARAQLR